MTNGEDVKPELLDRKTQFHNISSSLSLFTSTRFRAMAGEDSGSSRKLPARSTDSEYLGTVATEMTSLAAANNVFEGDNLSPHLVSDHSAEQDSGDSTTAGYATLLGALEVDEREDEEEDDLGPITTKHLLSWACQVARGMEYLTSKKVALESRSVIIVLSDPAR